MEGQGKQNFLLLLPVIEAPSQFRGGGEGGKGEGGGNLFLSRHFSLNIYQYFRKLTSIGILKARDATQLSAYPKMI